MPTISILVVGKSKILSFRSLKGVTDITLKIVIKHPQCRNGNGSGSGRIFSYPDPTRRARPVAWTRPVQGTRFFPEARTHPNWAPRAPFRNWAQFVPQPKKKKSRFFFPTFKPRFIFAIQAYIFQIKKLSPNLFLPTFKPAYLNSSLDNVAQMPNHRLLIINQ